MPGTSLNYLRGAVTITIFVFELNGFNSDENTSLYPKAVSPSP